MNGYKLCRPRLRGRFAGQVFTLMASSSIASVGAHAALQTNAASSASANATQATATPPAPDSTGSQAAAMSAPGPVAASQAASKSGLEEIIVVARRRAENVQRIPLSVSVLTPKALDQQHIVDPEDLSAHVPSLSVVATGNSRDSAKFTVRGQGQAPFGSEPAVINYFAEVPTITTGAGFLFDLDSVQVLKGPQGTLFGRNTTGGAILLQPVKPKNEFGGYLTATAGDYDLKRLEGAINVPIIDDTILARFSVDLNHRNGFTRDAFSDRVYDAREYQAYRFSLTVRPAAGLENYTMVYYTRSGGTEAGTILFAVNPTGLAAMTDPGLVAALQAQQARGGRITALTPEPTIGQRIRNFGVTNTTTYEISDNITLKNIFGYRLYKSSLTADADGSVYPFVQALPTALWGTGAFSQPASKALTDELQLQGKATNLNWILGLYGEHIKPNSSEDKDVLEQFGNQPIVLQSLAHDSSKAVFGQMTYDLQGLVPRLKLTVGGRYTWDTRAQYARNYLAAPNNFDTVVACFFVSPTCSVDQRAKFHAPSGNISLDYQLTPSTLVYVSSRHGYKSGGFNVTAPEPSQRIFKPEYVTDVELGVKTDFHVGTVPVRINADVYRGYFSDYQENGLVFDPASQQLATVTANAGKGIIQGFEGEFQLKPFPNVNLSGFYTYTDAYYKMNVYFGTDISNVPFTATPAHKVSVTAEYLPSLGEHIGTLDLSASYTYQSTEYFSEPLLPSTGDPQHGQRPYGLLNMRVGLDKVAGTAVDLSVFVNNVTNMTYKIYENVAYDTAGYTSGLYGEPRMFGVELHIPFGDNGGS